MIRFFKVLRDRFGGFQRVRTRIIAADEGEALVGYLKMRVKEFKTHLIVYLPMLFSILGAKTAIKVQQPPAPRSMDLANKTPRGEALKSRRGQRTVTLMQQHIHNTYEQVNHNRDSATSIISPPHPRPLSRHQRCDSLHHSQIGYEGE
jgi:hypothetical protein